MLKVRVNEIWSQIYYDGKKLHYAVSNCGRVVNTKTGYILKQYIDGYNQSGYKFVVFSTKKSLHHKFKVHRLVATYFVDNPDPYNKSYVNHIDGNKLNNHYTNLEWVTSKENSHHAWRTGLCKPKIGVKNGSAKLTEEQVHMICKLLEQRSGLTYREIGLKVGTTKANVAEIAAKKHWTHISCNYDLPQTTKIVHNYQKFYDTIDAYILAGETPLTIMKKVNLGDDVDYGKYESLVNHRREYLRKHGLL